ncbi:MAG: PBECR2 nuclease fold domain-containing protein [Nanoarchaeota archaeon]
MDYVFDVVDKTGRNIHLSNERWKHILRHKGIEQYLFQIKETLVKPDLIVQHKFDATMRNYYIYLKDKKKYLLVSVKYLNGDGYVATAFIAGKIIRR